MTESDLTWKTPGTYPGFGLESMAERAGLAGGKLTISSEQGQGTQISCKVRIEEA